MIKNKSDLIYKGYLFAEEEKEQAGDVQPGPLIAT